MLQNTLLNIEGLGLQLDPELDLWKTAKPWLERWMSEQVGWRGFVQSLKTEAPRYATLLPQLPRLLHEQLTSHTPEKIEKLVLTLLAQQQRRNFLLTVIAVTLLAGLIIVVSKI